jgi:hypothetical protein
MKKSIFIILLFLGFSSFGQNLEFCGSLNTSSEQRFQNSQGVGVQYQHNISKYFLVGLGVHYNFNSAKFDDIPYNDADPIFPNIEEINSKVKRFSVRLNIKGLLKENEYVSISLGPEISYNYVWGDDNITEYVSRNSTWIKQSRSIDLTKKFGVGLVSKIEVKNFIKPQLSLCFTIRPELIVGKENELIGANPPIFSGVFGFTEFQIGLKYRFGK